jgi:hypothetical protein
VTNEWLKLDQRTLFVERELGEALKRTDLPEGFCPQDFRSRWNALRLVLPTGLFGGQGQVFEDDVSAATWDIPSITFLEINKGQCLDCHPDLSEAQAAFFIKREGGINRIPLSEDGNEDGMGFYFYRRLSPDQKWSVPLYSACRLKRPDAAGTGGGARPTRSRWPLCLEPSRGYLPHRSKTLPF